MVVDLNIARLRYLLNLYKMSDKDFLDRTSEGLKSRLTEEDIFTSVIKVDHLKRIDDIFQKGLSFYTDPAPPPPTKESSIFFRKNQFADDLNFAAKKVINDIETFKLSFSATTHALKMKLDRKLPSVTLRNDPKKAAEKFHKLLYPEFSIDQKTFLTSLINKLANYNILVIEFIENWNQKEKANIDGAFIRPNVIVIKRQPIAAFRREIFTLAHEIGHYLLDIEEAENIDDEIFARANLNNIEKWCNDFAFYFLAHSYFVEFNNLSIANNSNDYHHEFIEQLSNKTHLSQMALYTRLLLEKKISNKAYNDIRKEANIIYTKQLEEEKRKKEEERKNNPDKGGGRPKPINSELLINTVQTAYEEGIISEFEMIKALKHRVR